MDIVVDTNALIAILLDEPHADAIVKATAGHTVLASRSVHFEIGNACVKALRRGRLTSDEVQSALASYAMMGIRFLEVDIQASVSLAHESGLVAYDAYILLCAILNDAPLLTFDKQLRVAAQRRGVELLEIDDG